MTELRPGGRQRRLDASRGPPPPRRARRRRLDGHVGAPWTRCDGSRGGGRGVVKTRPAGSPRGGSDIAAPRGLRDRIPTLTALQTARAFVERSRPHEARMVWDDIPTATTHQAAPRFRAVHTRPISRRLIGLGTGAIGPGGPHSWGVGDREACSIYRGICGTRSRASSGRGRCPRYRP